MAIVATHYTNLTWKNWKKLSDYNPKSLLTKGAFLVYHENMDAENWWLKQHTPREVYEDENELTEEQKREIAEMHWELENGR